MATSDEWWRHDEKASQPSSGAAASQNSGQEHYSLSGDTVAPWRKKDATAHLDAMRSKRDSRVRSGAYVARSGAARTSAQAPARDSRGRRISSHVPRTQYSQFKEPPSQSVPQFRDMTARHGGWNIPSLNGGNTGTKSSIFGMGRFGNIDKRMLLLLGAALLAIILVVVLLRGLVGCVSSVFAPAPEAAATQEAASEAAATSVATDGAASASQAGYTVLDEGRTTASGMGRMSFSAVGDNLMNSNLLELADSWSGTTGDGAYNFAPFYEDVGAFIRRWVDVSFINQETTLGGTDNFNYNGYPSYNTPDSIADAVAKAGWRIVNTNSNHTYDTWVDSVLHAQTVWAEHTSLVTVGSYASEADRSTLRLVECNGIRLATLSYSYGQNGYEQSDLPNDYYAVPYDEERLKSEVAAARKVADVVMVYLHAGDEYTNSANEFQKNVAQVCADNGVDLMIGSHAHVIQPLEWVARADGGGKMLAAYGLGDFVAGYTSYPDTIMSGMLTLDFVRVEGEDATQTQAAAEDSETAELNIGPGGIAIENVVWHPLIEHMENGADKVRFVSGYSDEEARKNELLTSLDDPYNWIINKTTEVIGTEFTIDM